MIGERKGELEIKKRGKWGRELELMEKPASEELNI